jgi:hypothetical protein
VLVIYVVLRTACATPTGIVQERIPALDAEITAVSRSLSLGVLPLE